MSFAWSSAALDELYRLYVRERRSGAQTAAALGGGVTRNAVLAKVQRLGWRRPDPEPKPAAPRRPERPRLVTPRVFVRSPFAGRIALPKLRDVAVTGAPRLWTERETGQCAFPLGEPAQPGMQLSCCAPTQGRGAYCGAHRALMILPDTALTPRDQDAIAEIARRAA